jgi:Mg/Co/Ni transporter MgtE
MDEWNESLLHMNAYLIAHALSKLVGGNRTIFVKAIKGNRIKDPETLIQILESPRIPADFLEIIFQIFDLSDLVERIEEIDTKHIIKIFHSLPLDKQEGVKRKLEISTDDVQSLSNLGEIGFFD